MKVKCILNNINKIKNVRQRDRLSKSIHLTDGYSELDIGAIYPVQAIFNWDGYLYYYLHTFPDLKFPTPYPAELFNVVDPSISDNWIFSFREANGAVQLKIITFREWANNDCFIERLDDADERRYPDDEIIEKTYLENMEK